MTLVQIVCHNKASKIDKVSVFWYFESRTNAKVAASLVDQTTPSAALDVLHHQHTEGGSGHSGRVFMTQRNAYNWEIHITACSVVTSVC